MRKAQVGVIGVIFLLLMFIVIWLVWLGSWVSEVGAQAVIENNLSGVEAFFFENLNLVILFGLILGIMAYIYFIGR